VILTGILERNFGASPSVIQAEIIEYAAAVAAGYRWVDG